MVAGWHGRVKAGGRTASENAVSYITTELKDKLKKADVEDLKKGGDICWRKDLQYR